MEKKNIFIWAGVVTGLAAIPVILIFLGYCLVGFIAWIISDPFNWVPEPAPYVSPIYPDVIACRERGGVPVKSLWNGDLKDCLLKP